MLHVCERVCDLEVTTGHQHFVKVCSAVTNPHSFITVGNYYKCKNNVNPDLLPNMTEIHTRAFLQELWNI